MHATHDTRHTTHSSRHAFRILTIGLILLAACNAPAQQRSVHERMAWSGGVGVPRVRNVMDYGAKGDGVTDDSEAIQKAIDAGYYGTWHNSGIVYFPGGRTYVISHKIVQWAGTILNSDPDDRATLLVKAGNPLFADPKKPVHLLMMRLSGLRPEMDNPVPFDVTKLELNEEEIYRIPGWPWKWPELYDTALNDEIKVHRSFGFGNCFWTQIRNLRFMIEAGNPGCGGLSAFGAEGSVLENVEVVMGDGIRCVGHSPIVLNCRFVGGRYGIEDEPGMQLSCAIDTVFENQTEAAYKNTSGAHRMMYGCTFRSVPVAVDQRVGKFLTLIEPRMENCEVAILTSPTKRPMFIQGLNAFDAAFLIKGGETDAPGQPGAWASLPLHMSGEVFVDGERRDRPDETGFQTVLPTWRSMPRGIDLSDAADVKGFGAVGDGRTDDIEAIRRAIAAKPVVFFPEGQYRVSASIELGPDTTLVGVHPRLVLIQADPASPYFGDAENRRGVIESPDDPAAACHVQYVKVDAGTGPGAIGLLWRSGRNSSVSYSDFVKGYYSVKVTGHGGGTFFMVTTCGERVSEATFAVLENKEPLVAFAMPGGYGELGPLWQGARDVTVYQSTSEGMYAKHRTIVRIEDSERIAMIDRIEHPLDDKRDPDEMDMIDIGNSRNFWYGPLNRIHNEPVRNTLVETVGERTIALGNRQFLLYARGDVNQLRRAFLKEWLHTADAAAAEAALRGETRPDAGAWTRAEHPVGRIEFEGTAGRNFIHAYAFNPTAQSVFVWLESTDRTWLWINGEERLAGTQQWAPYSVPVELPAGWNRILIAVERAQAGPLELRAAVVLEGNMAVPGLAYAAHAPRVPDAWDWTLDEAGSEVRMVWKVPPDDGIVAVRLLCNAERPPRNAKDGELVYEGLNGSFTNDLGMHTESVHYGLFTLDRTGAVSPGLHRTAHPGRASFLRDWLVYGPIACPDREPQAMLDRVYLENEADLDPDEGETHGGIRWVRYPRAIDLPDGSFSFHRIGWRAPDRTLLTHHAVYAVTRVWALKAVRAVLACGADDGYKIWLNGEEIAARPEGFPGTPDQDRYEIGLQSGWNRLVVKVTLFERHTWHFVARIMTADGRAVPGLRYAAERPGEE